MLYYFDTSWHLTSLTNLNKTAKNRFAVLGNSAFIANGADPMMSSANASTWVTTNCMVSHKPSLLFRSKGRLLASGDPTYLSRVYFSSVIDTTVSPFITWNENDSTGDWIDINPDDGGNVTGFAETSGTTLVFKSNGFYRLDTISKTTDPTNIYNIGAVSQEAIVACQGVVYFFSGLDIRRTNGGYPEQISRAGVQDFIDAILPANWSNVCAGTDGLNIYFSIGDITLNTNKDDQKTFTNVVLKFSPRDETWSVHSYANTYRFFIQYLNSTQYVLLGSNTAGSLHQMNVDGQATDNGTPIYFELETQEIEFGQRSHLKKIADKIVIYTENGQDSSFQAREDDGDFKDIKLNLIDRVNIGQNIDLEGHYFTFRWFGQCDKSQQTFEGFYIEKITDQGIV